MSVRSECKPRDSHCQRTPRQLQASPRTLLPVTTPDVGGRPAPHATTTPAGRPRRRRRGFTWAGRLALLTFALFVGAGAIGGGVAIATFLSLDDGTLPPVSDLEKISFPEQSVVYARDKTTELGAIRRLPPRRGRLEGHPARPGRRHHGRRGPHVLGEPGLRPDRDRGGRAGHVPWQRPWGRARSPSSWSASASWSRSSRAGFRFARPSGSSRRSSSRSSSPRRPRLPGGSSG